MSEEGAVTEVGMESPSSVLATGQVATDTPGVSAGGEEAKPKVEGSTEEVLKTDEAKLEEAKPQPRAPEEYKDFTLPEGMKLEGQDLSEFKSFAKEQDLTQEQAQKVLEFAGPKIKAMIEGPYKAWTDLTNDWWAKTKDDPEIGGTKLEQSVKDAGNAFIPGESNPFFKTEAEVTAIREALKATGAMHHPEVQRLFVRMGKMLAEPAHLTGKPAVQDKQQAFYDAMYPTMRGGNK